MCVKLEHRFFCVKHFRDLFNTKTIFLFFNYVILPLWERFSAAINGGSMVAIAVFATEKPLPQGKSCIIRIKCRCGINSRFSSRGSGKERMSLTII